MKSQQSKITTRDRLSKLRLRGKLVFTNGCFDILHPGHVVLLEKARRLGSFLVVAVNSDSSVRKLKGKSRPINSLAARMRVIAALESVDFVVPFSEETPLKTIQLLRPAVLVKGGDYDARKIVGAKEVRSWKGKVKIIPFVKGFSTSAILAKI